MTYTEYARNQLGWRTVLLWIAELPENEWITPKKFAELFDIPYNRALFHLWNLNKWCLVDKRKIPKNTFTATTKCGSTIECKISKRGIARIETMKENMWCTCNRKKTCMGCLIELLIMENFGVQGLSYLKKHIRNN